MKRVGMVLLWLGACRGDWLDPELVRGPSETLQVLVTSEPADDPTSGLTLAYGSHFELLGGVEVTGVRATGVPRSGAEFRVVLSQLLDSSTIEEFGCAGGGFTRALRCGGCPDDRATAEDETDRCIDAGGMASPT